MTKRKMINKKIYLGLGLGFGAWLLFGLMGSLFALLPDPNNPSGSGLFFVWGLSLAIAFFCFWSYYKKYFWAAVGGCFGITFLILAGAIHGIGSVIQGWLWSIPLVIAFCLAWLLPIINPHVAKIIHNEQFAPNSRLGKGCLFFFLGIGGMSGACGALFGMFSMRLSGGSNILMITVGVIFAVLAVGLSQTFSYQMWERKQKADYENK